MRETFIVLKPYILIMRNINTYLVLVIVNLLFLAQSSAQESKWKGASVDFSKGRLVIDPDRRHLAFEDGSHFPYFGDTAWELFHRLDKKDTDFYLENRRQKGFTVIQAVILSELGGLDVPTPDGNIPLFGNDPSLPNEKYFEHVDWVVGKAMDKGLFIGMLPTWGDKVDKQWGIGPQIFTQKNAFDYGRFLGERYKRFPNIIWIMGGDRSGGEKNFEIWRSMAEGIKSVDHSHLMTFHPIGERSSAEWFHNEDWLDFNMIQTGHASRSPEIYRRLLISDYNRVPVKPIMDGEPRYENHPVNWKPDEMGWFDDADVRQTLYWSIFSGGFGYTYGCHSIWQMRDQSKEPMGFARSFWYDDLDLPGAWDIIHARNLLSSRKASQMRPFPDFILDRDIGDNEWKVASRGDNFSMVYLPNGSDVLLDLSLLNRRDITAIWYNPRNGRWVNKKKIKVNGSDKFSAPSSGRGEDWILVIDF